MKRGRKSIIRMMIAMMLSLTVWLNVKPMEAAAAGNDVGVIGVKVIEDKESGQKKIEATLYRYSGDSNSVNVSFYRDGKKEGTTQTVSVESSRSTVDSDAGIVLADTDIHYYTVVISDDDNWSNNNRTLILGKDSGGTTKPDQPEEPKPARLAVQSISCTPSNPEAGQTVTFTVQVKNEGGTAASNVNINFNVGGQNLNQTVDSISAGGTVGITFTWTPGEAKSYSYTVNVSGDNNLSASGSGNVIVSAKPETAVKSVTLTSTGKTSDSITLAWGLENDGTESPDSYEIKVKQGNTDKGSYTASATGNHTFYNLEANTQYTCTVIAKKNGAEKSSKTITVTTDQKAAEELVEGIDLIVTDISWEPENPVAGDAVTFKAVIKNQGKKASNNGKHGVRFYIDDEENGKNCSGNKYYWSDEYKASLAPGESVEVTMNGNYNMGGDIWTATAGNHKVTAYVDDDKKTGDKDTSNNHLTKSFTVSSAQPPVDIPVDNTNADNVNVAAPGCYGDKENSAITILVNGKKSACINTLVNTSCIWDTGRYETTPLTVFEMKNENVGAKVRVALPSNKKVTEVTVRPLSAGIEAKIVPNGSGSYVEFEVKKWGSYSVEFNGETKGALQVFVNPDYSNQSLGGRYLPLGTVTWDAWGFGGTVYGSGILCSSHQGAVVAPNSGARYYGITILNEYQTGYGGQGSWEVEIRDKNDVELNYFHIIACSPNSDGISVQSSKNIRINNCYFRTWDDGIALKNYSGGNYTENIRVKDTVFWTDLAQCMEIGAETNKGNGGGPYVRNVRFDDITVLHANHKPAISIHNMDNAEVSDVHWSNVVIEDARMGNNLGYGDGWPIVIDLGTYKGGAVPGTTSAWTTNWDDGSISNVSIENVKVLSYTNSDTTVDGLEKGGATGRAPGIRVRGNNISGITIKDLYIGNTKIDSWATAKRVMQVTDTTGGNESKVTFE